MTLQQALRFFAGSLAISLAMTLGTSALLALRIEQFALDLSQSRAERQAAAVAQRIEAAFQFGVTLPDMPQAQTALAQLGQADASLLAAEVRDERGTRLHVWVKDSPQAKAPSARPVTLPPVWTQRLLDPTIPPSFARLDGTRQYLGRALQAPSGARAGVLWLVFDRTPQRGVWVSLVGPSMAASVSLAVLLAALATGAAALLMRQAQRRLQGWTSRALPVETGTR